MSTRVALFLPDGNTLQYEHVTDWKTSGTEIEFTDSEAGRMVSNLRYLVEESGNAE